MFDFVIEQHLTNLR